MVKIMVSRMFFFSLLSSLLSILSFTSTVTSLSIRAAQARLALYDNVDMFVQLCAK